MRLWKYIIFIETLILFSLLIGFLSLKGANLKLITCDVGQGDAILAVHGSNQILIDGGIDSSVLNCLGKYMPFWDREIELVVLTHPDRDHFGGLIDVFQRYKVISFLRTKATNSSQEYNVLESMVGGRGIYSIYAIDGQTIRLGKIYLDILNPEDSFKEIAEDNLNNSSIVINFRFDEFKALLTGDIEIEGINRLLMKGKIIDVDYLKLSHHGSINNITSGLLRESRPEITVISVGKNSYGHPNKETLDLLNQFGIFYLRTDEKGDIILETNGKGFKLL